MFPPLLDIIALTLLFLHFSVALAYYRYLKGYKDKSWRLKIDKEYRPYVTTIVPTHNEGQVIERRLDNLANQEYPKDKQRIIVVDSASTDNTALIVEEWLRANPSVNGTLISEPERNGKFKALQKAMTVVEPTSVAVILTDADALWDPTALSEVTSFLADPEVGSVTGNIKYVNDSGALSEDTYRDYYNTVRVAESKIHSTPIHNGPLLAIRNGFLCKIVFSSYLGSDDCTLGSLVAFAGYRAIQADTAAVREFVRNRLRGKIRRSVGVLRTFHHTKKYAKKMHVYVRSKFEIVWRMQWWLNVVNPWILFAGIILLVSEVVISGSLLASAVLLIGLLSLGLKMFRTWMLQQVYLVLGALRNLWTDDAIWNR